MPKRRGQGLQREVGSQGYNSRTLADLVDDVVNFFRGKVEAFSPAQQSPSQFVQNLHRQNKVTPSSDLLDQPYSLVVFA